MHVYEDSCFVKHMKSYNMTKELQVKRTRDSIFGLRDFMPHARALVSGPKLKLVCLGANGRGEQIHKLFLSGDCFKDFYSLDDEFPHPYPLNAPGFYNICVITI